MKRIIAILLMVSFVTVNTTSAFAAQRLVGRGRVSGRVEHRNSDRRVAVRRPDSLRERYYTSRSPLDRRSSVNRPFRRDHDLFRRDRPIARHNYSFFNRSRLYSRRPIMPFRSRPYYSGHRHSSSLSPLEFLGIGAAIIAIAAAANACSDY
jgi:Ni/Co efflux regulator RcnB